MNTGKYVRIFFACTQDTLLPLKLEIMDRLFRAIPFEKVVGGV